MAGRINISKTCQKKRKEAMRTKKTKTKTSQKAKPLAKVKLFYSEKNF